MLLFTDNYNKTMESYMEKIEYYRELVEKVKNPDTNIVVNSQEEIKKLGLKLSLTCTEGINYISSDSSLFKLKRFNRTHKRSVKDILVSAS